MRKPTEHDSKVFDEFEHSPTPPPSQSSAASPPVENFHSHITVPNSQFGTPLPPHIATKLHSASPEFEPDDFDFSDVDPSEFDTPHSDTHSLSDPATDHGGGVFPPGSNFGTSPPSAAGPSGEEDSVPVQIEIDKATTPALFTDEASDDGWDYDSDKSEDVISSEHVREDSGNNVIELNENVLGSSPSRNAFGSAGGTRPFPKTIWPRGSAAGDGDGGDAAGSGEQSSPSVSHSSMDESLPVGTPTTSRRKSLPNLRYANPLLLLFHFPFLSFPFVLVVLTHLLAVGRCLRRICLQNYRTMKVD